MNPHNKKEKDIFVFDGRTVTNKGILELRVWDTIIVYLLYKNRNELRHCFIYKGTNF